MLDSITEEEALFILKRGSTAHEEIITIKRIHAAIFGDLSTPVLLSRIIFWTGRSKLSDGWFYKTLDEMCAETALSERTIRNKVKKLNTAGIIETVVKKLGNTPVLHWRLKAKRLLEIELKYLESLDPAKIAVSDPAKIAVSDPASLAVSSLIQKDKLHKYIKKKMEPFELPDWVDKETWDSFCNMRLEKGLFTEESKKGIIRRLKKFMDDGEDIKAILENSIIHSWSGIFSMKNKGANHGKNFGNIQKETHRNTNRTAGKYADLHQEPIGEE